jgi:hypothetical protein
VSEIGGGQELALPLLGGGVVNLKDSQLWVRIAMSEGVEACAEEDVLGDAAGDGGGELVLGVAAAGYEEGAEAEREGFVEFGGGLVELGKYGTTPSRAKTVGRWGS